MLIHTLRVGRIETNCYVVEDEASRSALIIDPGDDAREIVKLIEEGQLKPVAIVVTHGHYDHVGANRELKDKYHLPIYMNRTDIFGLKMTDSPLPDRDLSEGEVIGVGSTVFRVIQTPGHSPGGASLYSPKEKVLFSGDTLFRGTYGRVDLPGSSPEEMVISLKKLLSLPPETRVYPGHGRPTTIGEEQGLLLDF